MVIPAASLDTTSPAPSPTLASGTPVRCKGKNQSRGIASDHTISTCSDRWKISDHDFQRDRNRHRWKKVPFLQLLVFPDIFQAHLP